VDGSMAKLASSPFQPKAHVLDEIEVTITRLDTLTRKRRIPPPDLVKIDVEGAELEVLKGATETLRTWQPAVLLEAHSAILEDDCARELSELGYRVRRIGSPRAGDDHTRHLSASVA
jgi:hypothetical protein